MSFGKGIAISQFNINVPYSLIKPVLSKLTPKQLIKVEELNEFIKLDSDELWKNHCIRDFAQLRKALTDKSLNPNSWRDLYLEKEAEIKEKEENMSKKLRALKDQESLAKQERTTKILEPKLGSSGLSKGKVFKSTSSKKGKSELMKKVIREAKKSPFHTHTPKKSLSSLFVSKK